MCQGSQSEKEQIRGIKDSGGRGATRRGVKERVEALLRVNILLKCYASENTQAFWDKYPLIIVET